MSIQFFAPKTLGSVALGVGALGGGGTIYWYQMPTTWRELLIKEGYVFLSTEHDYKGMFEDQKSSDNWKSENDLKEAKDDDVNTKAKTYCGKELDKQFPSSSDNSYSNTKKKLIDFCTSEGIQTVKARLIQNQKKDWLGENDTDKYKTIFAVYRYNKDFINWLKEIDKEKNKDLGSTSKVETGYSKLKDACDKLLKMKHREVENDRYFEYVSWWCVDPGYTKIKEKIQKSDPNWDVRPQSDSGWETLKNKWQYTEQVKKWANKANNGSDENIPELTSDALKKLCDTSYVEAKLSEEDSYQEKYLVIKSVCKKEN